MAKETYDNKKNSLKDLLKNVPPTPVQKVVEVKENKQWHLNCWIDNELGKRVKQEALNQGKSIKEITVEALENYLEQSERVGL